LKEVFVLGFFPKVLPPDFRASLPIFYDYLKKDLLFPLFLSFRRMTFFPYIFSFFCRQFFLSSLSLPGHAGPHLLPFLRDLFFLPFLILSCYHAIEICFLQLAFLCGSVSPFPSPDSTFSRIFYRPGAVRALFFGVSSDSDEVFSFSFFVRGFLS